MKMSSPAFSPAFPIASSTTFDRLAVRLQIWCESRLRRRRQSIVHGTPDQESAGANALLGVSMAALRADAASKKIPLYQQIAALRERAVHVRCMMNILNGPRH